MHTITLPSGPIAYRRAGSGPPLLLLHGWGGSSRYWRGTLERLADARTIYAPDLPGYGESPPIAGPATGAGLAALVIELADALGLARFDLNGHSFSASVAAYVAARWPHRVRRLVLTCFSTWRSERERLIVDQVHRVMALWMALRQPWMARARPVYRAAAGRFFYRMPENDQLLRESIEDFLRMDRRVALESAADSSNPAIIPALRSIAAPTLLIGARHDTIMPTAGTPAAAALIPGCRLTWIERCGHLPMIERPAIYHRLLRDFLLELDTDAHR